MSRLLGNVCVSLLVVIALFELGSATRAQGQTSNPSRPLVTRNIDDSRLVSLRGNTRPEANFANDRGAVPEDLLLDHMLLLLRRPQEQETTLKLFLDQLHDRPSPNFHHWLTAARFGERFGPAQQALDAVARWLESHGLQVNVISPSRVVIDFSGTAGQVAHGFTTGVGTLGGKGPSPSRHNG